MEYRIIREENRLSNGYITTSYSIQEKKFILGWCSAKIQTLEYTHSDSRKYYKLTRTAILGSKYLDKFSTEQQARNILEIIKNWQEDLIYKDARINIVFDKHNLKLVYINYNNGCSFPPHIRYGNGTKYGYEYSHSLEEFKQRIDERQPVTTITTKTTIIL